MSAEAEAQFGAVAASIPHHDVHRALWSGRVTTPADYPVVHCPQCGRRLPVTATAITDAPAHGFATAGQFTPTEAQFIVTCFVCGPASLGALLMSLDDLFAGAAALRARLDEQKWHGWVELLGGALATLDDAARSEEVGQSLLLLHDGMKSIKGHEERDAALIAIGVGSAIHWPQEPVAGGAPGDAPS